MSSAPRFQTLRPESRAGGALSMERARHEPAFRRVSGWSRLWFPRQTPFPQPSGRFGPASFPICSLMIADPSAAPEESLWSGGCSHWHFFASWLVGTALALGGVAALVIFREQAQPYLPWAYAVPAAIFLFTVISVWWRRGQRRYEVTRHRVIVESGRVVKDSNEIRVQDIRSINVNKRGLAGLIGIGTVEFSSAAADDADVIFVGIANADHVRDLVRKLQS